MMMSEEKNNLRITTINLSFGKLDADACNMLAEAIMNIGIGIDDEEVATADNPDQACDECYSEIAKRAQEMLSILTCKIKASEARNPDASNTRKKSAPCWYDDYKKMIAQYTVICDILGIDPSARSWTL